jgi:cyclopropane fatty-acyl-phospholipid synthase-like methyltransferase
MKEVNYKSFVGPEESYDAHGKTVFDLLIEEGLEPSHNLLDIGCGSVRLGKHLIPFLDCKKYHGLEPDKKWLTKGLENEVPKDILDLKKPTFSHVSDFSLTDFDEFSRWPRAQTNFDFAVACQVFIHCGVEQLKQCLANVSPRMNPNARFYISVYISEETVEYPYVFKKRYRHSSHKRTKYKKEDFTFILRQHGLVGAIVPPRFKSEGFDPELKFFLITRRP